MAISPSLRQELALTDKLPHYSTLAKFSERSQVLEIADAMIRTIGQACFGQSPEPTAAAMDATGLETTAAGAHFQCRCGGQRRKWIKISTIVVCGSLLPMSLAIGWGPTNDKCQTKELMAKAQQGAMPDTLYADAGYDAEWVHVQCREEWDPESIIKPAVHRADGRRNGSWRSGMSKNYLAKMRYGRRWALESFFSALKRTTGSMLNSRRPDQLLKEAAFRVLAYTLRREGLGRHRNGFNRATLVYTANGRHVTRSSPWISPGAPSVGSPRRAMPPKPSGCSETTARTAAPALRLMASGYSS